MFHEASYVVSRVFDTGEHGGLARTDYAFNSTMLRDYFPFCPAFFASYPAFA